MRERLSGPSRVICAALETGPGVTGSITGADMVAELGGKRLCEL